MRVLVAGASSVLGPATVEELVRRGHEVLGLTRSRDRAGRISESGATPVIGDVFEADAIRAVLARARPEGVVSLLIDLPRHGPRRIGDFE